MMNSLVGKLPATVQSTVENETKIRFKDSSKFVTPEALILYEQHILMGQELLDCCTQEYNMVLDTPKITYVPQDLINEFRDKKVIVLSYSARENLVTLGTIPEFRNEAILSDRYQLRRVFVPIYYYCDIHTKQFGEPDFLSPLPPKDLLKLIYQEAISLGASDITISSGMNKANIYYNARKRIVPSERQITKDDVEDIARLLPAESGQAMDTTLTDSAPRYMNVVIDNQHRGRTVINKTYWGRCISMRVLSNDVFSTSLESLNLNDSTCNFIRSKVLSKEKGLRLWIGETMSGKNTSILAALKELVELHTFKIVSVEQPVEILVDGIEQINAETDDEFKLNADSLLRQNPDFVYFTEITERTAESVMKQSNTAKAVFSTIHANSISDVLFRLEDITHMNIDRLLLTLHSCIYQELIRDDARDKIYPYTRCVYFSDDLKMRLYGKDIATIKTVLQEIEDEWDNTVNKVDKGLIRR